MGSILRRGDRFLIQWIDGGGRQRQRTLVSTSERAAEKEGRRLLGELEQLAERQRLGLAPLVAATDLTLGELVDWWWDRVKGRLRSHTVYPFLKKNLAPLCETPAAGLTPDAFAATLDGLDGALSAESLNKLRARAFQIYKLAGARGGPLEGRPNPIAEVGRRRVVRQLPSFLPAAAVPVVLAHLTGQDQQVAATAIYTGLRKGDIGGLRKQDVHLDDGELWVQRCWDGETTKDGKPSVIPIHPACARISKRPWRPRPRRSSSPGRTAPCTGATSAGTTPSGGPWRRPGWWKATSTAAGVTGAGGGSGRPLPSHRRPARPAGSRPPGRGRWRGT